MIKATRNYGSQRFIYRILSNFVSHSCLFSSIRRGRIFKKLGVDLANKVFVGQNVYFDELAPSRIHIGSGTKITRGVVLLTHFIDSNTGEFILGDIYIGANSFIGLNTIITKPVRIGNNCIIGAGSVVTKDIPDNSIAVGNPCRVIKSRNDIVDVCIGGGGGNVD